MGEVASIRAGADEQPVASYSLVDMQNFYFLGLISFPILPVPGVSLLLVVLFSQIHLDRGSVISNYKLSLVLAEELPLPVKVKRPCQPEALTAVSFRVVGRPIDGKLHPKNIAHTAKLEFSLHPPENRDSLGVLKI